MGAANLHLWNHCSHQVAPYASVTAIEQADLLPSTDFGRQRLHLILLTLRFDQPPLETWPQQTGFDSVEQKYIFQIDRRAEVDRFLQALLERCPFAQTTSC